MKRRPRESSGEDCVCLRGGGDAVGLGDERHELGVDGVNDGLVGADGVLLVERRRDGDVNLRRSSGGGAKGLNELDHVAEVLGEGAALDGGVVRTAAVVEPVVRAVVARVLGVVCEPARTTRQNGSANCLNLGEKEKRRDALVPSMMMMMSHLPAVRALYCGRFQYGEFDTFSMLRP